MLLRASGEFEGKALELGAINGEALAACGIEHADLMVAFADALVSGDGAALARVRDDIQAALGKRAVVDCAALAAVFNAVVRIADATGIPLEPYKEELSADLRRDLGIDDYPHAQA